MLTCWPGSTGFGLIVLCTWDFLLLGITIDIHLNANLEGLSLCSYASSDTQKNGLAFSFVSWKIARNSKSVRWLPTCKYQPWLSSYMAQLHAH